MGRPEYSDLKELSSDRHRAPSDDEDDRIPSMEESNVSDVSRDRHSPMLGNQRSAVEESDKCDIKE